MKTLRILLSTLVLMLSLSLFANESNTSNPAKEYTEETNLAEAITRGEARLRECLLVSQVKVPAAENKQLLKIWQRESKSEMTDIKSKELLLELRSLTPSAQMRGQLVIYWLQMQHLLKSVPDFNKKNQVKNLQISINSIMAQIFTEHPFARAENISAVVTAFKNIIETSLTEDANKSSLLLYKLGLFEEALIVEMQKTRSVLRNNQAEFEAKTRPILFALGGSATFLMAMLSAEPILAGSIGLSEHLGLGIGVGQTLGTGAIAGIGITGIDAVVEIAIPLWVEALQDAERRNIPLSCSLQKQAEISKAKELSKMVNSFEHGAQVGMLITGFTLVTPKIFSFFGGTLIDYGQAEKINYLIRTGKGLYKVADWVDEGVLIFVVGAVTVGAVSEGNEAWSSYQQSLSFNDLIDEIKIEMEIQKNAKQDDRVAQLDELLRLVKSTQIGFSGDAIKHTIDVIVCGYLVYHFAHGEFMAAWEGGVNQIIETLALGADDAPVGIKAAYTAAKKAAVMTGDSDPISIKIGLLKAKLLAMKLGLITPSISQSYDDFINMNNKELEENIREIQIRVRKLLSEKQLASNSN